MDHLRIESHKLMYHVDRVQDWLRGGHVYPVYMEIATSGACNHRCIHCALDFMGYRPYFLKTAILKDRLSEMGSLGVKSIMYGGEGEPLLHKDSGSIICHTKKAGMDVALTTNGVLFDRDLAHQALGQLTWIKVSINAGTRKTYAEIHRTKPADFDRVIENMSYAAKLRRAKHYGCTLGMQLLLLPENAAEVVSLAKKAKAIGMDYLVVKPYSHHPLSKTTRFKNIKYKKYLNLADELKKLDTAAFQVIFRLKTMMKWDEAKRPYQHCYALPFWAYVDSQGNVWGCSAYLGDKDFYYGNIYENTMKKIFSGPRYKKIVKRMREKFDTRLCRINCRMDEINRYLWELKHPPAHVNFI